MPAAAAAVVAAVSAAAAEFSLAGFLISTAISMALNAAGSALFGKKKPKAQADSSATRGLQDVIRSPIATHRVIYGTARVGGVMAYATTEGAENKYLHMVVAIAAHECEDITKIWLDDDELPELDEDGWVTSGAYANKIRIKKHLGSPDQAADFDLVSEVTEWTEQHRLRGRTYVYIKMIYDQDVFPTGIPTPRFLVKGKKDIYDPRTETNGWTNNWALCLHDFIGSPYGVNADADEFDEDNIIEQANICDEDVAIGFGLTQKRYTLDGAFESDAEPIDLLEDMTTAAAGSIVWTKGQYHLFAGAYRAPTVTLTADDFIGDFKVTPHIPRQELFNTVRGVFVNPDNYWQDSDLPVVKNAIYVTQDGGEEIVKENILRYTIDNIRGQRINKIHLEKTRQGIQIEALANYSAQNLAVMRTVYLHLPKLGWFNKVFIVLSWEEDPTGGIRLTLQEEAAACYDWNYGEATVLDPAPNAQLPNPRIVANPTGLTVSTKNFLTDNGTSISRIYITWTAPQDAFVTSGGRIEIQFKGSSEEEWEPSWFVAGDVTQASTPPVEDSVDYDIRIRSENRLKVRAREPDGDEAWSTIFGYTVGAATAGAENQLDYRFITEAATIFIDRGSLDGVIDKELDYGSLTI